MYRHLMTLGGSSLKMETVKITQSINCVGMSCPGPIMQLGATIARSQVYDVVQIMATDKGFHNDLKAWCRSTGHSLLDFKAKAGVYTALVRKEEGKASVNTVCAERKTVLVFSDDLDKAMAAFVIANGAAASGKPVTMFFTFWGLNLLLKKRPPLGLSKTNVDMTKMQEIMEKQHVPSIDDLLGMAKHHGIRLVACTMAMEMLGVQEEELIEGVELGGIASYLGDAEQSNLNLFI